MKGHNIQCSVRLVILRIELQMLNIVNNKVLGKC